MEHRIISRPRARSFGPTVVCFRAVAARASAGISAAPAMPSRKGWNVCSRWGATDFSRSRGIMGFICDASGARIERLIRRRGNHDRRLEAADGLGGPRRAAADATWAIALPGSVATSDRRRTLPGTRRTLGLGVRAKRIDFAARASSIWHARRSSKGDAPQLCGVRLGEQPRVATAERRALAVTYVAVGRRHRLGACVRLCEIFSLRQRA